MKVNLSAVAQRAGVSVSTVSKAIRNYSDIAPETRKRVLEAMSAVGYAPHGAAKAPSAEAAGLIGVVFAGQHNIHFNHPFFIDVLSSFRKQMGVFGCDLLFFANEGLTASGMSYLERCRRFQVDGCLIIQGDRLEPMVHELDHSSVPCIGVDMRLTGSASGSIMSDNQAIAAKVVEHFYLQGYREIGYIGSMPESEISRLREMGLADSLEKLGLRVNRSYFIHGGDFYETSGYESMKALMERGPLPRALFAGSDLLAMGAMRALKEQGYRIPEDVAIVGCDDVPASRCFSPALSTVKQDKHKLGKLAALMLFDLMNNQTDTASLIVEPELIVRESCTVKR